MSDRAVAFAPGRVNLIGEHTDYNSGLALPFAISQGVTVRAARLRQRRIEAFALDLEDSDAFELEAIGEAVGWRAFVRGAANELIAAGVELAGAELQISGSVPLGSGMSSSAALTVALCIALLEVSGAERPAPLALARLCSRVENQWVGAQSGLLDQLASLQGATDRALHIDFRSLEVEPVALALDGHVLVALDSGKGHIHGNGQSDEPETGYNQRRAECKRACELLGITSLREADAEMLAQLPELIAARVRHVITENTRVDQTVTALEQGDLARVGELLNESHASLRDNYDVSTPAVERTVERLREAGALGARIMGGGFGGHVLGLLPDPGIVPEGAIVVKPGPGARLL